MFITRHSPSFSHATAARAPAALLLVALAAVGCGHPVPETQQRRVDYRCADGSTVQMRFFPAQGVGVLVQDGRTRELQQQPAGSGFLYTAPGLAVRGQGDELRIEPEGGAARLCRAG